MSSRRRPVQTGAVEERMQLDSLDVSPPTPWTRRFAFSWPQNISFFEHRYEVLRELEDQGLLRQLRVAEDRIALRLGDANHELVFGVRSVEGSLLQPDGDWDRIVGALKLVLQALKPKHLLRPEIKFQWLVELDGDYDKLRSEAAIHLFGAAGASMTDWSVLVDGKIEDPEGEFQAEFGILNASEAPARLARLIGRAGRSTRGDRDAPPPTQWQASKLPPVGWFYDVNCSMKQGPEPTADAISHFMRDSEASLGVLMSGIMEECVKGDADIE